MASFSMLILKVWERTWRHIRIGECRSWPMVRRRLRARSTRCSTTSRTRATNHTGFLEQDLSRRQAKGRSVLARRSWATMLGDDDRPTAWSDASAFLADGAHDAAPVRSQLGPSPPHARELIDAGPGRAAPRARDGATRTARAAAGLHTPQGDGSQPSVFSVPATHDPCLASSKT